jgi:hypothetical protein
MIPIRRAFSLNLAQKNRYSRFEFNDSFPGQGIRDGRFRIHGLGKLYAALGQPDRLDRGWLLELSYSRAGSAFGLPCAGQRNKAEVPRPEKSFADFKPSFLPLACLSRGRVDFSCPQNRSQTLASTLRRDTFGAGDLNCRICRC